MAYLYATIFIFHFTEILISTSTVTGGFGRHLRHWEAGLFLVAAFAAIDLPSPASALCGPTRLSVWRGDSVLPESTSVFSSEGHPSWCSMAAASTALLTLPPPPRPPEEQAQPRAGM